MPKILQVPRNFVQTKVRAFPDPSLPFSHTQNLSAENSSSSSTFSSTFSSTHQQQIKTEKLDSFEPQKEEPTYPKQNQNQKFSPSIIRKRPVSNNHSHKIDTLKHCNQITPTQKETSLFLLTERTEALMNEHDDRSIAIMVLAGKISFPGLKKAVLKHWSTTKIKKFETWPNTGNRIIHCTMEHAHEKNKFYKKRLGSCLIKWF